MKKFGLIAFITVLLLAACGFGGDGTTPVEIDEDDGIVDGTPAAVAQPPPPTVTPTPTLMPTYTPAAMVRGEHLYATTNRSIHIVQPGDTLGEIAKLYGIPVNWIAIENNINDWDVIEVGMVLYIPCEW